MHDFSEPENMEKIQKLKKYNSKLHGKMLKKFENKEKRVFILRGRLRRGLSTTLPHPPTKNVRFFITH